MPRGSHPLQRPAKANLDGLHALSLAAKTQCWWRKTPAPSFLLQLPAWWEGLDAAGGRQQAATAGFALQHGFAHSGTAPRPFCSCQPPTARHPQHSQTRPGLLVCWLLAGLGKGKATCILSLSRPPIFEARHEPRPNGTVILDALVVVKAPLRLAALGPVQSSVCCPESSQLKPRMLGTLPRGPQHTVPAKRDSQPRLGHGCLFVLHRHSVHAMGLRELHVVRPLCGAFVRAGE